MKKLLPFLKAVYGGLTWFGQVLVLEFRANQFSFFPSEGTLMVSLWYSFAHQRKWYSSTSVYDFLDGKVRYLRTKIAAEQKSLYKKELYIELLQALYTPHLREVIISFLLTPDPQERYAPVMYALRSAWRTNGDSGATEDIRKQDVQITTDIKEIGGALPPAESAATETDKEGGKSGSTSSIHAKTYVIAAEIHFELAGKAAEFRKLSRQLPDLEKFVQQQFGVTRLPGSFRKFKEYSYKTILEERNDSKLGQLKPHFRQIIDHPEIFGLAVAKRARQILDDYFV